MCLSFLKHICCLSCFFQIYCLFTGKDENLKSSVNFSWDILEVVFPSCKVTRRYRVTRTNFAYSWAITFWPGAINTRQWKQSILSTFLPFALFFFFFLRDNGFLQQHFRQELWQRSRSLVFGGVFVFLLFFCLFSQPVLL